MYIHIYIYIRGLSPEVRKRLTKSMRKSCFLFTDFPAIALTTRSHFAQTSITFFCLRQDWPCAPVSLIISGAHPQSRYAIQHQWCLRI